MGSAERKEHLHKENVPNLRFPEFSGEWEKTTIGKILTIGNGRDYKHLTEGNIPVFGTGGYMLSVNEYLYDGESVFIGRKGTINKPFFFSGKFWTVDTLFYTHKFVDVLPYFVYGLFQRINWNNYNEASGVPSLSKSTIEKISINVPIVEEQRKIANLMSLLDDRIATQIKIIEDLKKLKSAISKQIFVQKPICWNRLDTLFSKGKAGGTPTSTNKDYYNGDIPFLSINDITKQGKYIRYTENHLSQSGLDNSSAWIVPAHSLIMSMYASVGLVTINEVPITTSQAMFAMQLKDKGLLDYLYYYLSYFKYRHIHKYLETGTQSNINADIVRSIMIPDYGHGRNIEIASTLQSIDAKIDNELSILEQFNKQKNYLLSQMFI